MKKFILFLNFLRRQHIEFLVAISLFEPMWYVREVVKNTLSFTSHRTGLVLHLNADTAYTPEEAQELWQLSRVEVSCWRLPVKAYAPETVLSHAFNIDWAFCRGARPKFVLFMASNMWWVRKGMELSGCGDLAAIDGRRSSTRAVAALRAPAGRPEPGST